MNQKKLKKLERAKGFEPRRTWQALDHVRWGNLLATFRTFYVLTL